MDPANRLKWDQHGTNAAASAACTRCERRPSAARTPQEDEMSPDVDKEVAIFIARVGEHVKHQPKASLTSKHRAVFLALRPLVQGALASGYTMKAAWATLRTDGKI